MGNPHFEGCKKPRSSRQLERGIRRLVNELLVRSCRCFLSLLGSGGARDWPCTALSSTVTDSSSVNVAPWGTK